MCLVHHIDLEETNEVNVGYTAGISVLEEG
jgi:hypothetical protein